MSISTVITFGYGSFGGVGFIPTLGYTAGAAAATTIDTHDGFDGEKKHHERKRKARERLHNQVEEAFRAAFEKAPQPPPVMARNDEPLVEFVFPAYRESMKADEQDETEEWLLLTQ